MPVITITTTPKEEHIKAELIKKLTSSAAEAINLPEQAFTVYIYETPASSIGVGGKTLEEYQKSQ